jgi:pyridoxal 5'-phosphate synthase pdxS subunit
MAGNGHLTGTFKVNSGMAQMLRGRVIMDVVNVEQGKIAEEAGAVVVMVLERVPADIRAQDGAAGDSWGVRREPAEFSRV